MIPRGMVGFSVDGKHYAVDPSTRSVYDLEYAHVDGVGALHMGAIEDLLYGGPRKKKIARAARKDLDDYNAMRAWEEGVERQGEIAWRMRNKRRAEKLDARANDRAADRGTRKLVQECCARCRRLATLRKTAKKRSK